MRIKLASWYGDKAPGEEIDVDDATAKALSRDGLVAEILGSGEGATLEPGNTEPGNDTGEPEPVEPAASTSRKRR